MAISTIGQEGLSSGAQYTGFKNRIINGDMRIDQRNNGQSTAGGTSSPYTLDRWKVYSGGANVDVQRVAGPGSFQHALRINGVVSNTGTSVYQRIESFNCYDLVGGSISISFWAYNSTSNHSANITIGYPVSSTADDWSSGQTTANNLSFTLLNGWNYYTFTVTDLNSNCTRGIQFVIELNAVLNGTARQITNVQLEKGSTATSFDYRPYDIELQLCQRYFITSYRSSGYTRTIGFATTGSGTAQFAIPIPCTMRTDPSLTTSGTLSFRQNSSDTVITGIASVSQGPGAVYVAATMANIGNGIAGGILNYGTPAGYTLSAEL